VADQAVVAVGGVLPGVVQRATALGAGEAAVVAWRRADLRVAGEQGADFRIEVGGRLFRWYLDRLTGQPGDQLGDLPGGRTAGRCVAASAQRGMLS